MVAAVSGGGLGAPGAGGRALPPPDTGAGGRGMAATGFGASCTFNGTVVGGKPGGFGIAAAAAAGIGRSAEAIAGAAGGPCCVTTGALNAGAFGISDITEPSLALI
tara:strand:+ start:238 stop:555 length:318 start_codon:yes stop_codon:yes gene_type:complete